MLEVRIKKSLPGFNLDVAFSVDREILAILGPSGSGKTMTLQCIAGLVRPDEGFIKLNDKVLLDSSCKVCLPPRTRKIGFVFQNYALFPHLTVKDNVSYGIKDMTRPEIESKVSEWLEKMNITGLEKRYPRQLSAGQQQRVALARALATGPEILLLDEPFSALDTQVKERMELELMALQSYYHGNILLVTHNLVEGYRLASKIAVYETGRIIQCDEKSKVITSPASRTVARLTGVRNLMRGKIVSTNGKEVSVSVPELGGIVKVIGVDSRAYSDGQSVTIGIRPEYIHLVENPGENTFSCTADRIVESVSQLECYLHVNTVSSSKHWVEVSFSRMHAGRICEGQPCNVYLPPEHVALIQD